MDGDSVLSHPGGTDCVTLKMALRSCGTQDTGMRPLSDGASSIVTVVMVLSAKRNYLLS